MVALGAVSTCALVACGSNDRAGGAPPSATTPAGSCRNLPEAVGPDVAGSLAQTDSGGTFCLHLGQSLDVFLSVPLPEADTGRWTPVRASDGAVLHVVPSGALTLPRGVTAAIFAATQAGTSELTSTRPPCAAAAPSGCPAGQGWRVIIVVKG